MTERSPKKRAAKRKNAPPSGKPKNRYARNSKLSEYRFLKVLKGFADDNPAKEVAASSRISEKTIRAIFAELRTKLIEATLAKPFAFGGAGHFLLRNGRVGRRGRAFFEAIYESDIYQEHIRRHAPRLKNNTEMQGLIYEVTVRLFCHISMQRDALITFPDETTAALHEMRDIAAWIRGGMKTEGFAEKYADVIARFGKITEQMETLLENEQLLSLRSQSTEHRFANDLLYSDLRRFLLKSPL
ncbi:MAG: hypothetical protein ACE360_00575 [Hyphomicrobiales bacterium]